MMIVRHITVNKKAGSALSPTPRRITKIIFITFVCYAFIAGAFYVFAIPAKEIIVAKHKPAAIKLANDLKVDLADNLSSSTSAASTSPTAAAEQPPKIKIGTDILSYQPVSKTRGIYATMWTILAPVTRQYILSIFEKSDLKLNAIVINIKDDEGNVIFDYSKNIRNIISEFRSRDIRVIGRIVVMRDNIYVQKHPDAALKKIANVKMAPEPNASNSPIEQTATPQPAETGGQYYNDIWRDAKGSSWIDPTNAEYRNFIQNLSLQALNAGFDEIQYDYFRYPSEGSVKQIIYPSGSDSATSSAITDFAQFLQETVKPHIPISIDIFGQTLLTQQNDAGIGQNYLSLEQYFDYVSPMVYPSHYAPGNFGFKNPAEHPVEIIGGTLLRLPKEKMTKIRPWLQAFDLSAIYDKKAIYTQIKTAEYFGVDGWLIWNPRNIYDL